MSIEEWLLFLRIAEHFVQDEDCLKRTAKCSCPCFSIVLCYEINCKSIIKSSHHRRKSYLPNQESASNSFSINSVRDEDCKPAGWVGNQSYPQVYNKVLLERKCATGLVKTRKYSLSVQFFFNIIENLKPPMNEIGTMPDKDAVYCHTFEKSFLFPEVQ